MINAKSIKGKRRELSSHASSQTLARMQSLHDEVQALKRQVTQKVLDFLTIVPIPYKDIVSAYVEIDDYSRQRRRVMGKNDVWIAATARVTQAIILTTDHDFDHLSPHLITREYIDPNIHV